jgi:hypothetical protein
LERSWHGLSWPVRLQLWQAAVLLFVLRHVIGAPVVEGEPFGGHAFLSALIIARFQPVVTLASVIGLPGVVEHVQRMFWRGMPISCRARFSIAGTI